MSDFYQYWSLLAKIMFLPLMKNYNQIYEVLTPKRPYNGNEPFHLLQYFPTDQIGFVLAIFGGHPVTISVKLL